MPFAVIQIDVDPSLHLGPFTVHWYGILYAVAFVVAFRYGVIPHVTSRGSTRQEAEQVTGWVIVAGLIGARLYYDVQQPLDEYLHDPVRIVAVWEGGMGFFGAIFASCAALILLARRNHRPAWMYLDGGALFAAVGQPIGRIGNIINGDILGGQSTLPWATAYTNPHAILQAGYHLGVPYQPAGAYEGLITLAILGLLLCVRHRGVPDGAIFLVYFVIYAVSQLLIFFIRQSEPVTVWGLKQSQWTALAMLAGLPVLFLLWRRTPRHGVGR